MTFLAPWALVVGALAALGAVLLHLIAQQRPAAFVLPTARFIPDRRTLVRRMAARPRDLALLALRVLLLLSAAAAFARPVLAPRGGARARILLLDRSSAVRDPRAAIERARAIVGDGVPTRLVLFDSAAHMAADARAALDSVARTLPARRGADATTALASALLVARRAGAEVARGTDSVELVLLSPVARAQLGAAADSARRTWPGAMRVERLAARLDSGASWRLERALDPGDPLGPAAAHALASVGSISVPHLVRILHRAPATADSAFAARGNALVLWDTTALQAPAPTALVVGDDVVVAPLGRAPRGEPIPATGRVIARWLDGQPAAVEHASGDGCLRIVRVGLPSTGDLPLRFVFQRAVRGLLGPCASAVADAPVDSLALARFAGANGLATAANLRGDGAPPSPLVPWLLGVALASAVAELLLRSRRAGAHG